MSTDTFTYYFVYKVRGSQVNAPATPTYDQRGEPISPPATGTSFPLHILAQGSAKASYVTIVGQATPGHYSYIGPDGTAKPVTDQPNGMSFPLALAPGGAVTLPSEFQGARIFFSAKPLTMPAATIDGRSSDSGYVQPDLNNPADPNQGNPYDFFEYTFKTADSGQRGIAFGGNTTQVDGFSIPITAELRQDSSGIDQKVGIEGKNAAQIITGYKTFVGDDAAFASLVNADNTHITAPRSAPAFQGGDAAYFDTAVTDAWAKWRDGFTLVDGTSTFEGETEGDKLSFRKIVAGKQTGETGTVTKPTTAEVAACNGSLSTGTSGEKFVEAHLCAAFNRGITHNDPSTWSDPSTYYNPGTAYNKYAAFFHRESISNLAYAFAYDDVYDQSSVMVLPNAQPPSNLTLTLGG
ncbi:beta-1,3-glucanase family protein [Streptomyces sp. NPDC057910]|uniref:beta-1,3-glucanase family protein n=1 Tax=Streptomyces sp. NPDC057910 TaxID=3346278 RepID=UPI0036ED1998